MNNDSHKLPIGIQSFEKLITERYIYVDKTDYIYNLVHSGASYFLSRPRRFGKSLLLSTLKSYWEGKRELFSGLLIEKMESDNADSWQKYPVFYFDFNKDSYNNRNTLENILEEHLVDWEQTYKLDQKDLPQPERFRRLIKTAYELSGKGVVVLVDEYDKPLLDTIADIEVEEHNKNVFKGFFSTLKSYDEYIKFNYANNQLIVQPVR